MQNFFYSGIFEEHKNTANLADCVIRPAPASIKANIWKHFGCFSVYAQRPLDKSHAVDKSLCIKIKFLGNTTNMQNNFAHFHNVKILCSAASSALFILLNLSQRASC